ncbi:Rv0361 family membrane protein [Dactylosporangium sp. CA-139066]|uniref:Rv0361 family membrane protein n=1 Tax=Dactylosporangium sp. CA-139066 TaxID=3239930 RepID=UPI003D8A1E4D
MSKTAKVIIFSLIGAFVLCCGGGGAGLFFFVDSKTKAAKTATGDFLAALEAGDNQAAYELLCAPTQVLYGPEAFDAYVKKNPPTSHDMGWGGSYSNDNGHETATITATVTFKSGSESHEFELMKQEGTWKVCGNPY